MHIIANLLFTLAAIALVPTLGLLTFWDRFPACPDDLSKYQTLLGPPILAASLALIGSALTSWNQWMISAKQLGAQRREQDRALSLERQQTASAFIGEIDVILNELHEFSRPAIEKALRAMESGGEEVDADVVRISKHLGRLFENSPTRVRLLPKPLSGELMRFYYLVEETRMDIDWYCRDIEIYINQKVRIMKLMQLVRLLKQILAKLTSSENLGRTLLGALQKIRDTGLESLDQSETLGRRVKTKCAPGSWYQKLASKAHENVSVIQPSNQQPRHPAKLRLMIHARSQLSRLMPFIYAAKVRMVMHAQSWLNRLMPFVHAAKLRVAMRVQSWLSRLMPFVHAAKLRVVIHAQSWLSRLMPFIHTAKVRMAMHAQSWLSRLMPFIHAAKLRVVIHAQSWLSRLMPFAQAAKLRVTIHAQSWLSRLMLCIDTAKVRVVMRARSGLTRLMPFVYGRFLVIFFSGIVTTLAWQAYGDVTMAALARWSPHCGWRQAHSSDRQPPLLLIRALPSPPISSP
jgi:branched-subunit amino acid transport protein